MLNLIYGYPSKALHNVQGYVSDYAIKSEEFVPNGGLPPESIETDFAKKVIFEVDKSVVHHARDITSSVLGTISFNKG